MKNRNKKVEKKVFTKAKYFDYTLIVESTYSEKVRVLGPIYEKDERPLKEKLFKCATTTSFRARSFVIALYKCGFTIINPNKTTISVVSL